LWENSRILRILWHKDIGTAERSLPDSPSFPEFFIPKVAMKSNETPDRVYLDRNENNYGPAPACIEVLGKLDPLTLSFYTKAHSRGVKSTLSERLAKEIGVPEEHILLGYGAEDLLKQTIQCYLKPGAKLMIPGYSWWYYKAIASEVGGENVEYPMGKGKDRFLYDVPGMLEVYRKEKPGVVFISSPNNPTGNSMDAKEMTTVLEALKDVPVVLDQAYWYNAATMSAKEIVDRYPNTLLVRTFSKYYALAGARIGFAIAGAGLEKMVKMSHRYLGYSRLSEEIALAALNSPDYYNGIAKKMAADKEAYYKRVGVLPGLTVFRSDANFLLVEIPSELRAKLKEFFTAKGLILKFMDEPMLNSHIRITLGTQEQNERVIAAFEEFFAKG
jgi:histidinol-phosphate aminotransferase